MMPWKPESVRKSGKTNRQAKAFKDSEALALLKDQAEHRPSSQHR
jgi:hypothetical protein